MSYEPTDEEIYRRYHSRSEFSIRNWWPSSSEEDGDEEEVDGRSCAADSITLPDEEVEADTSRTNTHDPFMNRQAAIIRTTDPCQPLSKTVVPTLPKSARKEIAKEKKRQKNKSQKLPPSVAKTPQQIVHNHWSTLGKQNGRNENCCKCLLDAVLVGDDGNEVSKSSSVNSNNFVREGILYDIISGVRNYVKDNVGEISDEYYIEFIRTVLQGIRRPTNRTSSSSSNETKSYARFDYKIGDFYKGEAKVKNIIPVCGTCFSEVYQIHEYKLKQIKKEIKTNKRDLDFAFNDQTRTDEETIARMRNKQQVILNTITNELEPFNPTPQELAAAWTPNGYKFQMCITWLAEFFDLVGDHDPTSVSGEIHIEQQTKHEIWEEYVLDMKLGEELDEDVRLTGTIEQISSSYYYLNQEGEEADEYNNQQPSQSEIISSNNNIFLSYQQFCQVWKNCFDHVKIRKFKAVTGKCTACSQLTNLRCKFKSVNHRKQIHDLHQFHRITYMSERRAYYKKIWHARSQPDQFMSIILDGMAQNHTHLPWMANQSQSEGLEQHLQGLIEHGRAFTVYRTFENVVADSNLVIHVILLQIEKRLNQDKKLPPTLYLQVDGGAENANKTVLAFCELLVGRRVFKYVFLNRLMVGHTHEDIDGKYGNLWSYVRKRIMATPQDYAKAMKATYSKPDQPNFELVDLYVIPDYKAFFAASISHLMGFAKLEHTQLAWKFEHLDTVNRAEYPLNVNVMYRAFDTDVVYELIPSDKFEIGFGVARVYTKWGPTIDPMYRNTTEGMYILKELPFGQFKPAEFKPDHAAVFKAIREKIVRKLFPNCSEIKQEWEDFSRIYPQVNTSAEYVVQLGGISSLHVPLYDKLFGYLDGVVNRVSGGIIAPINSSSTQNSNIDSTAAVLQRPNNFIVNQVATHSVQWDNRGVGVEVIPPRLEVPDGIDPKDVNLDLEALRIQHLLKLATASTKEELGKWTIPTLRAICALKGIMGMSAFKIKADFVNALFQILQTEQRRETTLDTNSSSSRNEATTTATNKKRKTKINN